MRIFFLFLFVACNSAPVQVQPAIAQPAGPNGLPRVWTVDGGLCVGGGWPDDPVTCTVTTDLTVSGTGSAGSPLSATADFSASAFFCDGSDGTVTFDGTSVVLGITPSAGVYLMNRDICCSSCTINAGVTINAQWRFHDSGTLTLNGKIARNGNNASGATGGAALTNTGWINSITNGGGNGGTAAGAAGGGCSGPKECSNTGGTAGVAGGACKGGGGGNGASAGASSGSITLAVSHSISGYRTLLGTLDGFTQLMSAGIINCGSGGGGGGGGSGLAGGGGGGGGGFVYVAARQIVGTGSVEGRGGNGGNGNAGAITGGGGGGGGGTVTVLIGTGAFPTIDVSGGTGGAPGLTGVAGGTGGAGLVSRLRVGD